MNRTARTSKPLDEKLPTYTSLRHKVYWIVKLGESFNCILYPPPSCQSCVPSLKSRPPSPLIVEREFISASRGKKGVTIFCFISLRAAIAVISEVSNSNWFFRPCRSLKKSININNRVPYPQPFLPSSLRTHPTNIRALLPPMMRCPWLDV